MVRYSYYGYYDRIHYKYYCYMSVEEYLTKIKGYKGKKTYNENEIDFDTEEDRQKFRNGEEFIIFDTKEKKEKWEKLRDDFIEAGKEYLSSVEKIPDEYQKMVDEKWDEHMKKAEEGIEDDGRFNYVERECPNCGSVQLGSYYDICENCSYLGGKVKLKYKGREIDRDRKKALKNIGKSNKWGTLKEINKNREEGGHYKYALDGKCPECKSNVTKFALSCPSCKIEFMKYYKNKLSSLDEKEKFVIFDWNLKLEIEKKHKD